MSKITSLLMYISIYTISSFLISRKKYPKLNTGIAIMLLTLLAAYRYEVGTDYNTYVDIYNINAKLPFAEWLHNFSFTSDGLTIFLISKLAKQTFGVPVFFGSFALLTNIFTLAGLNRNFPNINKGIAIFIFLCTMFSNSLNIMKQILAISICFYGLRYVFERKLLNYIIIVLFAMTVHISAFVALIIYFLWDNNEGVIKINFKYHILFIGIIISIINYDFFLKILGGRFSTYTVYDGTTLNLVFFIDLIWLVIFLIYKDYFIQRDQKNKMLMVMFAINVVLLLTGFISPFIKRIALYFSYSSFILMAQLPYIFVEKDRKIIKILLIIYIVLLFIIMFYLKGDAGIIPFNYKIV